MKTQAQNIRELLQSDNFYASPRHYDIANAPVRAKTAEAVLREQSMKPVMLWSSKTKGTYNKKQHGPLVREVAPKSVTVDPAQSDE